MRKKALIFIILVSLISIFFPKHGITKTEKLRVGYPGVSTALAHLWIAKEAGLFEKYGLDVEAIFMRTGTILTQSLISGEMKLAETGTTTTIRAMLAGAELTFVAGYVNALPYTFFTAKGITRPEQLKGKKVAVSGFGAESHVSVIFALRELGLIPGKDVAIVQIGDQSTRFSALEANSIQGLTITPPLTVLAKKRGFYPMVDLSKANVPWSLEVITVNKLFLKENPEVVKNFLKGFIEGLKLIRTDKAKSIDLLARFMKLDPKRDEEALEEAYEYMKNTTEKKPYPSLEGIKNILEFIAEEEPRAKIARPEQFFDLRILQELDKSGFIDSLYK